MRVPKSKSTREYAEGLLARVDEERSRTVTSEEIQRILTDFQSADEQVRVRALREVCPCRMPWPVFEQLRKPALRLRKDPSPAVRAAATHIEQDAAEVAAAEATRDQLADLEEARHPTADQKRFLHAQGFPSRRR